MKNIVITGHLNGIGKALHDESLKRGFNVIGFDLNNGYDINDESTRNTIIEKAIDADIFINNAYAPESQTILLKMILDSWQDRKKLIININSKISFLGPMSPEIEERIPFVRQYYLDKSKQLLISREHLKTKKYPLLLNVLPGYVLTDFSKKINPGVGIKPETVAKMIFSNLEFMDEITVNELMIDCPVNPVINP